MKADNDKLKSQIREANSRKEEAEDMMKRAEEAMKLAEAKLDQIENKNAQYRAQIIDYKMTISRLGGWTELDQTGYKNFDQENKQESTDSEDNDLDKSRLSPTIQLRDAEEKILKLKFRK